MSLEPAQGDGGRWEVKYRGGGSASDDRWEVQIPNLPLDEWPRFSRQDIAERIAELPALEDRNRELAIRMAEWKRRARWHNEVRQATRDRAIAAEAEAARWRGLADDIVKRLTAHCPACVAGFPRVYSGYDGKQWRFMQHVLTEEEAKSLGQLYFLARPASGFIYCNADQQEWLADYEAMKESDEPRS